MRASDPRQAEERLKPLRSVEIAAYRANGHYRAVCLDFGLMVERPQLAEARDELILLVRSYVEDAKQAGMSESEMLRPVSRWERLYVYFHLAVEPLKLALFDVLRPGRDLRAPALERFEHLYLV